MSAILKERSEMICLLPHNQAQIIDVSRHTEETRRRTDTVCWARVMMSGKLSNCGQGLISAPARQIRRRSEIPDGIYHAALGSKQIPDKEITTKRKRNFDVAVEQVTNGQTASLCGAIFLHLLAAVVAVELRLSWSGAVVSFQWNANHPL